MKLLLSLAASFSLAASAFSQGTVNFANGGARVNAPISYFGLAGASPANGPWLAMLYAGPDGTAADQLSSSIVSGAPAELGATPGYVFGGARTISGISPGSAATLQIRVWRANEGATWEEVWNAAAARPDPFKYMIGAWSTPITITLGGGATPTPNMVGLASFSIIDIPVPEPSAPAVIFLGLLTWAFLRRVKPSMHWQRPVLHGRSPRFRKVR